MSCSHDNCQEENQNFVTQIVDLEEQVMVLVAEKVELDLELKDVTKRLTKGKGEACSLHLELEGKLNETKS